ncbi:hypothetical protein ACFC34_00420 [Streptomyces sp. NPDC056053]|uniref:hypothetical protein n=1 Tax=Streptomyces sp. NPDC056053 TaxID=3345696 RepID=UPI0035DBDD03
MSDRAQQLLRLVDRARRGTALPAELDQLADGITEQAARITTLEHVAAGNRKHVAAIVPELERAQDTIARARALHQPTEGLGFGCDEDDTPGSYGDIAQACTSCGTAGEYGVRWPCPTIRALAEQQPTCCCGESTDPRVVHRVDGPCHMDEQPTT